MEISEQELKDRDRKAYARGYQAGQNQAQGEAVAYLSPRGDDVILSKDWTADAPPDGWRPLNYLHAERARVPADMVLVPREPTQEMLDAFQEELCRWSALTRVDDEATAALWRAQLAAAPSQPKDAGEVEDAILRGLKDGVTELVENGDGRWETCSGCYESEDGHPVGNYPYSKALQCTLGGGCSECGGLGAIWDATDYEALGRELAKGTATTQPEDAE